ncbi:MAG: oxidoreductase, partial [Proteobacteria bacterium]|nr:oxidoreductase [Pseudomonadota bacterium]
MSAEQLGVGVIGMSWVAGEHIKSYQLNPHTNVVALAGADAKRVSAVAAAHSLTSV